MNFGEREPKLGVTGLEPKEQQRLEGWLDAARTLDLSELEQQGSEQYPQRRSRHVRHLMNTIKLAAESARERGAARQKRWWGLAAVAGLALFVAGGGYAHSAGWWGAAEEAALAGESGVNLRQVVGKVIATHPDGKNQVIDADAPLRTGDEISTAARAFASLEAGAARLDLSSATTLRLQQLERDSEVFHLQAGRVDVSVPKLPGVQREVKVTTKDVVVTVHGTLFSVEVHPGKEGEEGPVTQVEVSRGLVSVERNGQRVMLRAGQSWSSHSPQASQQTGSELTQPRPVEAELKQPELKQALRQAELSQPGPSREKSRSAAVPARRAPALASDLADQNALFEQALQARDRGDDRTAITRLERLLSQYPTSPLRATAQVELRTARKRVQETE